QAELEDYLNQNADVTGSHPILVDAYLEGAECEVDAIKGLGNFDLRVIKPRALTYGNLAGVDRQLPGTKERTGLGARVGQLEDQGNGKNNDNEYGEDRQP
ncbi:hypothetical protein, partial [Limosilactobacillus fermentum]|uniref:hypothetical protein n=1 Tax=Limosilactobacillus fermentum TaxID=1613 RepID=UPI0021C19C2C